MSLHREGQSRKGQKPLLTRRSTISANIRSVSDAAGAISFRQDFLGLHTLTLGATRVPFKTAATERPSAMPCASRSASSSDLLPGWAPVGTSCPGSAPGGVRIPHAAAKNKAPGARGARRGRGTCIRRGGEPTSNRSASGDQQATDMPMAGKRMIGSLPSDTLGSGPCRTWSQDVRCRRRRPSATGADPGHSFASVDMAVNRPYAAAARRASLGTGSRPACHADTRVTRIRAKRPDSAMTSNRPISPSARSRQAVIRCLGRHLVHDGSGRQCIAVVARRARAGVTVARSCNTRHGKERT